MNWKTVAHLVRVDMKSGRLIRGQRLIRYRQRRVFTYLLYGGVVAAGLLIAVLVGLSINAASAVDLQLEAMVHQGALSLFLSLPTLVLVYSLVFTMMQQIQRSGMKLSVQVPYWLPITWEEHTLASILANLLGFPLLSILFIGSAIITFSVFIGEVGYAVLTLITISASAFMASAITEIFRLLQVRFIGAVYKSSGRAAVWVRFVGSLLFFIVFYIIYFTITSGVGAISFVQTIASAQISVWFIPLVWLGVTVYSFINRLYLLAVVFLTLSSVFIIGLFFAAVLLNRRFGLYEPPAITVSRGIYTPRTGLLGKLGFSTAEAALVRKDLKAFTRRRELMYIFVVPIVIILVPLMQAFGGMGRSMPTQASLYLFAVVFLMPSALMSVSMGNLMIGEEGGAVWRIYSAPVSAGSLVKSKYFFLVFFSTLVTVITGIVGVFAFHPSLRAILAGLAESLLMVFALGAVSLTSGIKGADFTELPRPRMIRTTWGLINLVVCLLAAVAILAPFIPYAIMSFLPMSGQSGIDLYQTIAISAVVAVIITFIAYRMALRNARDLLAKAET